LVLEQEACQCTAPRLNQGGYGLEPPIRGRILANSINRYVIRRGRKAATLNAPKTFPSRRYHCCMGDPSGPHDEHGCDRCRKRCARKLSYFQQGISPTRIRKCKVGKGRCGSVQQ
jgi:hypothetical protein